MLRLRSLIRKMKLGQTASRPALTLLPRTRPISCAIRQRDFGRRFRFIMVMLEVVADQFADPLGILVDVALGLIVVFRVRD